MRALYAPIGWRLLAGVALALWSCSAPLRAMEEPGQFEPQSCAVADAPPGWAEDNRVDCGFVTVPARDDASSQAVYRLWVFRIRAHHLPPDGKAKALVRMVGGPIPRTLNLATLDSLATRLERQSYDVIFFDYRGLGKSSPDTSCKAEPVAGAGPVERLHSKLAQYAACRRQIIASGIDLKTINSRENGRDADRIARAMGYHHYAIRGGSYANLPMFDLIRSRPSGLEAAVIDLVSPPNAPTSDFLAALGDGMERWQGACNLQRACKARFPDLAGTFAKAMDRLERDPLLAGGKLMTPLSLAMAVFDLGWDSETLPLVPLAIETAANGDRALVARWLAAQPPYDFTMPDMTDPLGPLHATLACSEDLHGKSSHFAARKAARRYPYLARLAAPLDAVDDLCRIWRAPRAPVDLFAAPRGDVPILLSYAALDPSRPPSDAALAAHTLPHAIVIGLPGLSHQTSASDCQYGMEAAFLAHPSGTFDRSCLQAMSDPPFALEGFETFVDSLQ